MDSGSGDRPEIKDFHTMVIRHRRKIASLLKRLESRGARHTANVKSNGFARELTLLDPNTFLHSEIASRQFGCAAFISSA